MTTWPTSAWIVAVFLALYALRWAVTALLHGLNLARVRAARGQVPRELAGHIDADTAERGAAYTLARGRLGWIEHVLAAPFALALLFSGVLPALDRAVGQGWGPLPALGGVHASVVYLLVLGAIGTLAGLPFSLYSTFRIEQRVGFNKQSLGAWVIDRLKGLAVSLALGVPFLYGVLAPMTMGGDYWWLWAFGFVTAYQFLMVWLFPLVIAPLFNKFTPLPEGELKARLEALARGAGFRTRGLYTMDASRRTGHSNAYFTGLGRAKRIVLFDTMLERMSADETLSVLAHEIGHFRMHHIRKRLVLGTFTALAGFALLGWLAEWQPLYEAFGFDRPSPHALLALAALCGGAFTFWLAPLSAWWSRRHEYEADAYSVGVARMPEALKTALVGLSRQNLSNLHPHPWYSAFHYSHPPLRDRLAAIDRLARSSQLDGHDGTAKAPPAAWGTAHIH
jgi:STE24 endopeptidase